MTGIDGCILWYEATWRGWVANCLWTPLYAQRSHRYTSLRRSPHPRPNPLVQFYLRSNTLPGRLNDAWPLRNLLGVPGVAHSGGHILGGKSYRTVAFNGCRSGRPLVALCPEMAAGLDAWSFGGHMSFRIRVGQAVHGVEHCLQRRRQRQRGAAKAPPYWSPKLNPAICNLAEFTHHSDVGN